MDEKHNWNMIFQTQAEEKRMLDLEALRIAEIKEAMLKAENAVRDIPKPKPQFPPKRRRKKRKNHKRRRH